MNLSRLSVLECANRPAHTCGLRNRREGDAVLKPDVRMGVTREDPI